MEQQINGFFDDEGNPIDPFAIPKPGLCFICRENESDNSEENMLCAMNRWDQKDGEGIECGMFEQKE